MTEYPKLGARVRYSGNVAVGPCIGTVTRHYEEREGDRYVRVKVDATPNRWPFPGRDEFAALVQGLELIKESE